MVKKVIGDTSYRETKFGILPRKKVIHLEAKGTEKGLLYLKTIAEKNIKLTVGLLNNIHQRCFSDILGKNAGRFRTIQVQYSGREAPHYSKVYEMMKNLCEDTEYAYRNLPKNETEDYVNAVVVLLSEFQHRFLFIHPYIDYNGRLARMFTNFLVMRLNLPIIEIKVDTVADRKKYITALQKADDGDYRNLHDLISQALNESLLIIKSI